MEGTVDDQLSAEVEGLVRAIAGGNFVDASFHPWETAFDLPINIPGGGGGGGGYNTWLLAPTNLPRWLAFWGVIAASFAINYDSFPPERLRSDELLFVAYVLARFVLFLSGVGLLALSAITTPSRRRASGGGGGWLFAPPNLPRSLAFWGVIAASFAINYDSFPPERLRSDELLPVAYCLARFALFLSGVGLMGLSAITTPSRRRASGGGGGWLFAHPNLPRWLAFSGVIAASFAINYDSFPPERLRSDELLPVAYVLARFVLFLSGVGLMALSVITTPSHRRASGGGGGWLFAPPNLPRSLAFWGVIAASFAINYDSFPPERLRSDELLPVAYCLARFALFLSGVGLMALSARASGNPARHAALARVAMLTALLLLVAVLFLEVFGMK